MGEIPWSHVLITKRFKESVIGWREQEGQHILREGKRSEIQLINNSLFSESCYSLKEDTGDILCFFIVTHEKTKTIN